MVGIRLKFAFQGLMFKFILIFYFGHLYVRVHVFLRKCPELGWVKQNFEGDIMRGGPASLFFFSYN